MDGTGGQAGHAPSPWLRRSRLRRPSPRLLRSFFGVGGVGMPPYIQTMTVLAASSGPARGHGRAGGEILGWHNVQGTQVHAQTQLRLRNAMLQAVGVPLPGLTVCPRIAVRVASLLVQLSGVFG